MHTWPLLRNLPVTAICAPTSGSASGKTMNGACPPSSRLTRLTCSAQPRSSCLPTSVEPVKLILRQTGFSRNSSAISWAGPMTRVATPGGGPVAGVAQAGGQAGLGQALEPLDQAQGRLAGRPADDGAAGRQR